MSGLRTLVLTNLFPNPLQPHRATFNRQQFGALARRQPVEVIAPVAWVDEVRLRVKAGGRLPARRRGAVDGIPVEYPRYLYPPLVCRHWYGHFFRASVRFAFWRAVRRFRPEVVLAAWAYPDGWGAVELGRQAGLPVVVKVHGSDVLELPLHPGRRARTADALCRADGVVAVSRHLAVRVAELGVDPQRIRVIYDGVDGAAFRAGDRDKARARLGLPAGRHALCVANLVPVKGHAVLLDALARLKARGAEVTCHLIGDGPLRSALAARAAELGLGDSVRLVGAVAHERLPDWFRAADVFVLASRSEGVPCVLLEALACGTPFVASAVGGIPEIAHLGLSALVPPGDAGRLADEVGRALAAPPPRPPVSPVRGHAAAAAELASFLA
ncbi:MAG TPA: glycosyltransferase, partial [Gemmataceae bacterium]|nr:glycosyltransferase [Gemmataceae bacterium]